MSNLTEYGLPVNVSEWIFAADLYGKYGFPAHRGSFARTAIDSGWRRPEWENIKWRKRQGKGGGYEYHYTLLPPLGDGCVAEGAGQGEQDGGAGQRDAPGRVMGRV